MPLPFEDFNVAWRAIRDKTPFRVVVADVVIEGSEFTDPSSYWLFDAVQSQGLAWRVAEAAILNRVMYYVVSADKIAIGFLTPLGWTMIPLRYYAWGRLPGKSFRGAHGFATDFLTSVLEVRDDDGEG